MTLQLHRPDGQGGLEKREVTRDDWRTQLRSARWGSALNAEMNPTSRARSVVMWASLAALTFALLVLGYGTGFWH
jgi:hypothetical protein